MSGLGRRPLLVAVALLAASLVGYELLPNDERRITRLLNELCVKLNQARDEAELGDLERALSLALLPNASVRVSELGLELQGVSEVNERMHELLASGVPLSFALNSVEVHLSGQLARVDLDLLVTTRGSGEQSRDLRHTHVRLAKSAPGWRIEAVEIDALAPSEPEARP
jgi:hypothetical protein